MENEALDAVQEGMARVNEAAEFLDVSRRKVYMAIRDGSLPSAKIGKSRRIPWRSLKQFAASRLVGAAE